MLCPEPVNFRIIGRPFRTAIRAPVIVSPVAIFFAIGFVVLAVVADQILQGETIVRDRAAAWFCETATLSPAHTGHASDIRRANQDVLPANNPKPGQFARAGE